MKIRTKYGAFKIPRAEVKFIVENMRPLERETVIDILTDIYEKGYEASDNHNQGFAMDEREEYFHEERVKAYNNGYHDGYKDGRCDDDNLIEEGM